MLSASLRSNGAHAAVDHGHGHGHAPALHIKHQASYMQYTVLNSVHAHHEPNFRKAPAGWAGWGKQYGDPFAPFPTRSPLRHFDRVCMGMHYGAGHTSLKFFRGRHYWKWYLRMSITGALGLGFAEFCYWERMNRNGWLQKNKSAVMGEN